MLLTDDTDVAERVARLRLHGINADAWNRYGAGGKWFYEVTEPGFKYNLTDVAAAVGLVQLDRLDEMVTARTAIAARYDAAFDPSDLVDVPPRRASDRHAWHLYVIRLRLENIALDKADVIKIRIGVSTIPAMMNLRLRVSWKLKFTRRNLPRTFRCDKA